MSDDVVLPEGEVVEEEAEEVEGAEEVTEEEPAADLDGAPVDGE